jgi:hypothetical protein
MIWACPVFLTRCHLLTLMYAAVYATTFTASGNYSSLYTCYLIFKKKIYFPLTQQLTFCFQISWLLFVEWHIIVMKQHIMHCCLSSQLIMIEVNLYFMNSFLMLSFSCILFRLHCLHTAQTPQQYLDMTALSSKPCDTEPDCWSKLKDLTEVSVVEQLDIICRN